MTFMHEPSVFLLATGDINIHIGKRIRYWRKLHDIPQQGLADLLEISVEQLQQFESGEDKISAAQLYEIAVYLGVSINCFYDEDE